MITKHIILSFLGLGLAGKVVHYLVLQRRKSTPSKDINEVLFFPDKEYPCSIITQSMSTPLAGKKRQCYNPSCRKLHGKQNEPESSMIKFLDYLSSAKFKVDLCIYMFTQSTLARILRYLHEANIKVRIITDGAEDEATGSQVEKLRDLGVEIKSNKQGTGALMHHKFVIIDDDILLSGSFNWTNKAVVSNYEAVLVTSNKSLVIPFIQKFDEMWADFGQHPKRNRTFR